MARRDLKPAKRPRGGSAAGGKVVRARVTPAEEAAIRARAARTHGGDVSAHLRAGSELAATVREVVDLLINASGTRALTDIEDYALLLLAPELRAVRRLAGWPLTSDPAIRRAG